MGLLVGTPLLTDTDGRSRQTQTDGGRAEFGSAKARERATNKDRATQTESVESYARLRFVTIAHDQFATCTFATELGLCQSISSQASSDRSTQPIDCPKQCPSRATRHTIATISSTYCSETKRGDVKHSDKYNQRHPPPIKIKRAAFWIVYFHWYRLFIVCYHFHLAKPNFPLFIRIFFSDFFNLIYCLKATYIVNKFVCYCLYFANFLLFTFLCKLSFFTFC